MKNLRSKEKIIFTDPHQGRHYAGTLRKCENFVCFKGWVQCFSMQVVMNKCFLLNPEKMVQTRLDAFEKNVKNAHFNFEK